MFGWERWVSKSCFVLGDGTPEYEMQVDPSALHWRKDECGLQDPMGTEVGAGVRLLYGCGKDVISDIRGWMRWNPLGTESLRCVLRKVFRQATRKTLFLTH